jgi:hypothetical protein
MLMMKNFDTNRHRHVTFMLLDIILKQWQRAVASSEALALLHWVMHMVTYRCIAMAIETASKVGVCLRCCFVYYCLGSHWGNT